MKRFINLSVIITISVLAAYKVLMLGLLVLSSSSGSVSIGAVGIKSSIQTFTEFFIVAIFLSALLYFLKTKQKVMMIISFIGVAAHIGLLMPLY